ncbi:hypothetical protein L564_2844, partial [Bordetella pertussis CHLA-15]
HRARCTHLQTQPGQIQPIDSSQLGAAHAPDPGMPFGATINAAYVPSWFLS